MPSGHSHEIIFSTTISGGSKEVLHSLRRMNESIYPERLDVSVPLGVEQRSDEDHNERLKQTSGLNRKLAIGIMAKECNWHTVVVPSGERGVDLLPQLLIS